MLEIQRMIQAVFAIGAISTSQIIVWGKFPPEGFLMSISFALIAIAVKP